MKETNLQLLIQHFYFLKGWEWSKETRIIFPQFTKPASQLLQLTDNDLDHAKLTLERIKWFCESKGLEWNINTAVKNWMKLKDLDKKKKQEDVFMEKRKQEYLAEYGFEPLPY